MNYPAEHATVSGGVPLTIPKEAWSPVKQEYGWRRYENWNNVQGLVRAALSGAFTILLRV